MFHDVCEFGMNNFIKSTHPPSVCPFPLISLLIGTGGAEGEIQLFRENGICIRILLSCIMQSEFSLRAK